MKFPKCLSINSDVNFPDVNFFRHARNPARSFTAKKEIKKRKQRSGSFPSTEERPRWPPTAPMHSTQVGQKLREYMPWP